MRRDIKVFPLPGVGSNVDHRKPNFTGLRRAGEVDVLPDHQSGLRGLTLIIILNIGLVGIKGADIK